MYCSSNPEVELSQGFKRLSDLQHRTDPEVKQLLMPFYRTHCMLYGNSLCIWAKKFPFNTDIRTFQDVDILLDSEIENPDMRLRAVRKLEDWFRIHSLTGFDFTPPSHKDDFKDVLTPFCQLLTHPTMEEERRTWRPLLRLSTGFKIEDIAAGTHKDITSPVAPVALVAVMSQPEVRNNLQAVVTSARNRSSVAASTPPRAPRRHSSNNRHNSPSTPSRLQRQPRRRHRVSPNRTATLDASNSAQFPQLHVAREQAERVRHRVPLHRAERAHRILPRHHAILHTNMERYITLAIEDDRVHRRERKATRLHEQARVYQEAQMNAHTTNPNAHPNWNNEVLFGASSPLTTLNIINPQTTEPAVRPVTQTSSIVLRYTSDGDDQCKLPLVETLFGLC